MPFQSRKFSILSGVKSSTSQQAKAPEILPPDVPIDEERIPNFNPENFYPANPGDVLEGKYELLTKLGWGTASTVWLARDSSWSRWSKTRKYVAIKICTSNVEESDITHELDITIHLSKVKSQHRARGILGTAIGSFGLESPNGSTHLALVFEPLREPLWLFRKRIMGENRTTRPFLPIFKTYIQILLEGLDFLHSEGHVVHTDLKLDNIMVVFEGQSVIEEFIQAQSQHPMAQKKIGNYTLYRCHNNFGDIDGKEALKKMYPKITDFGLAQRVDKPGPHIHPIQPDTYHAPEVLLGTGWSSSVDIWNFGLMVWELLAGHGLFQRGDPRQYSPVGHLAEMIALMGPIPPKLIQREKEMRRWKWSPEVPNNQGILCNNANDFYGGPFLTEEGKFVRNDLVPYARSLQKEMPECISEEESELFLQFMRRMLHWLPEERATAKELKDDPWLKHLPRTAS
ncbi:putative serine/threonine-protein kinase [Stachybotrys elegans]|uniref:Serine/threonine-protein kinase n=1 Tax=Stachybotrys elegans TaxID=80388 RepID=A0A8K0SPY9_9HYPO|nr:putative serine/threonine-protein kinase [Stachybotrys elegans]